MSQEKDPLSELGWLAYIAQKYGRKDVADEIATQIQSAHKEDTSNFEKTEDDYPIDTTRASENAGQTQGSQGLSGL